MKKFICLFLCIAFTAALSLAPTTAFAAANAQGTVYASSFVKTVRVTGVSLSKTSLALTVGKTYKLTATVKPASATNKKVTWKSGNKTIATVSSTGNVKGIKAGSVYIYVYTADGNKSAKCKVAVKEPVNTYGNTPGNIANGGIAAQQGDWVYYINVNGYLCKSRMDGTGKQTLCSDNWISYINVVGDWVYYSSNYGNSLYKIRTNGKNRTKLCQAANDGTIRFVSVTGGWVYYSNVLPEDDGADFYKIRTDGTGRTKYSYSYGTEINVVGGWIYSTGWEADGLYKMRTDGSGGQKLSGYGGECLNVVDGWIYYGCYRSSMGYVIEKIRTNGTERLTINTHYGFGLNVTSGWIYYTDVNGYLYKSKTDGNDKIRLCSDQVYDINVLGDWVYYRSASGSESVLYKIKTNGTGRQKVQ